MSKCWTPLLELNYGSGHIKALEGLMYSRPYALNLGNFWVHTRKEVFRHCFCAALLGPGVLLYLRPSHYRRVISSSALICLHPMATCA